MVAILRLIQSLGEGLPLPILAALAATLVIWLGPAWWNSLRTREIRGLVRRIGRGESVPALTARAFRIAGSRPDRLALLAAEANRRGLQPLREAAFAALTEVDPARAASERVGQAPPKGAQEAHPLAAVVAIEGLIAAGAWEAAGARLASARARFPDDPELAALADRIRSRTG